MKIIKFSIFLVFIIFILEFFSFIFVKFKLLSFHDTPYIYLKKNKIPLSQWRTEEHEWGAWHKSNYSTIHKKKCFDVSYSSNEIGARDSSFKDIKILDNNIFLIGDSFAEGYGVNIENTAQYLLEKKLKRNVLNFGASGNFGPVQYWLIYNHFSKLYKHNTVIIFLLPDNDFTDNDFSVWNDVKRYRPYYLENEGIYKSFIPAGAVKETHRDSNIYEFIKKYFWFSNTLRSIKFLYIKIKNKNKIKFNEFANSGYYNSKLYQQKATIEFLDRIINSDKNKKYYLVSIPRPQDIDIFNKGNFLKPYWIDYYQNKEKKNTNFKFIDLIHYLPKNYNKLYLECDGHWSTFGNKWASEIIYKYINN